MRNIVSKWRQSPAYAANNLLQHFTVIRGISTCKEGEKQPKCTFIIQKTFNQCRQIQIKRILVRGGSEVQADDRYCFKSRQLQIKYITHYWIYASPSASTTNLVTSSRLRWTKEPRDDTRACEKRRKGQKKTRTLGSALQKMTTATIQNFQFEGNLAARFLRSRADTPNGGWRSELQIYSFEIQNIQMSTIFSCMCSAVNNNNKKETRVEGVLKAQTLPKASQCPRGVTAQVWPLRWRKLWRVTVCYRHHCKYRVTSLVLFTRLLCRSLKHSATFNSSHWISLKAQ